MNLNYIAYYNRDDGYGRFNSYLVRALQLKGFSVKTATETHLYMPHWMQKQEGLDWNNLTVSSLPPNLVKPVPGRHWVLTMLEGSVAPKAWVDKLNSSGAERILVPCRQNKEAFERSGVTIPIYILPGGTNHFEFYPAHLHEEAPTRPYNFLTFADRGFRKGVQETYDAFYIAFGGKTSGIKDVKLSFKYLPGKGGALMNMVKKIPDVDQRFNFIDQSIVDMRSLYVNANCLVLPSRAEGWGMPHREAAMSGLPVITQKVGGLDDGHLEEWALVVEGGKLKPIPQESKMQLGEWMIADKLNLAEKMWWCYENYQKAREFALGAREWLMKNQTWSHSAALFKQYLETA